VSSQRIDAPSVPDPFLTTRLKKDGSSILVRSTPSLRPYDTQAASRSIDAAAQGMFLSRSYEAVGI
jgi:hypothetical protein